MLLHEIGERDPQERVRDGARDLAPDGLGHADIGAVAGGGRGDAVDEAQVALERSDDLEEIDRARVALQRVAAVRAAEGLDQAPGLEGDDDLAEVFLGDFLVAADVPEEDRTLPVLDGEVHHEPQAISGAR